MQTTIDLPDALVRAVQLRAVKEGRDVGDAVADLLRLGLAASGDSPDTLTLPAVAIDPKTGLPLIECPHGASADDEMTPDRVADILLQQEVDRQHEAG